jgi:hypothetical protein
MIKSGDAQAVAIWEEYNKVAMNAYPQFSNSDIDNILAYTDYTPPAPVATVTAPVVASSVSSSGFSNNIILAALSLVFFFVSGNVIFSTKNIKTHSYCLWN